MTKAADQVGIFVTIGLLLTGCVSGIVQGYSGDLPEPRVTTFTATPEPTEAPTPTPGIEKWLTAPTAVVDANKTVLGWTGNIGCYDCTPFTQTVKITFYNPNLGDINCWIWSDDYDWCMSNTYSEIPWESVWGIGAACPAEWPIGTWVEIPEIGSFICFDHGDMVLCDYETGICNVDLLGPGGENWDGSIKDATLWVPLKPRSY